MWGLSKKFIAVPLFIPSLVNCEGAASKWRAVLLVVRGKLRNPTLWPMSMEKGMEENHFPPQLLLRQLQGSIPGKLLVLSVIVENYGFFWKSVYQRCCLTEVCQAAWEDAWEAANFPGVHKRRSEAQGSQPRLHSPHHTGFVALSPSIDVFALYAQESVSSEWEPPWDHKWVSESIYPVFRK